MHVDRNDTRPDSMLDRPVTSTGMLVGGALTVFGAHVLVPLAFMAIVSALAASGIARTEPHELIDDHVIAAEFVKLGVKMDPNKLPQRKVPIKATAPDDSTAISKKNDPPPPEKIDAGVRPDRPEEDLLTRLGDRAQEFAEIADKAEEEGDPEGIEGGTSLVAQAGNIYAGQLKVFFARGWTIPQTLVNPEKLVATVTVEITRDLKVGASKIVKSSGEPLFDQSIEDRIEELRTLRTTVPEPPPELAPTILGREVGINFSGRDAN